MQSQYKFFPSTVTTARVLFGLSLITVFYRRQKKTRHIKHRPIITAYLVLHPFFPKSQHLHTTYEEQEQNPTSFRRHVASPSRLPPRFLVALWFALAEGMRQGYPPPKGNGIPIAASGRHHFSRAQEAFTSCADLNGASDSCFGQSGLLVSIVQIDELLSAASLYSEFQTQIKNVGTVCLMNGSEQYVNFCLQEGFYPQVYRSYDLLFNAHAYSAYHAPLALQPSSLPPFSFYLDDIGGIGWSLLLIRAEPSP